MSSMASMQTQMYAFCGFGDSLIVITAAITTTITVITTSWCCASSWCCFNDSNWMNPTWLWLRAKRPDRRKAERRQVDCFPSASHPEKIQQASEKACPDAFPRALENVEGNTDPSECMLTAQGKLPRKSSLSPREVFLLLEFLSVSPCGDCYHQPNFQ